jgi:competence protein ComGC
MKLLAEFWLWGLSVVVLFLGLFGSAKLLRKKYGRKVFAFKKGKPVSLSELLVIVSIVTLLLGLLLPSLSKTTTLTGQMTCGRNLYDLGKALRYYSEQFEGKYPPAEKWCDLLKKYCDVSPDKFKCPQDKKSNCSFTFNPFCEPSSPPDMVLLFESIGGWNSSGGQQLIKPRHQDCGKHSLRPWAS